MSPILEEVVFRYGVQKRLNSALEKSSSEHLKKHAFQIAAVASSVLFGLMHMVAPEEWGIKEAVLIQAISAGAFGFFGLSKTYKEHGLLGSISSHITFNAMGISIARLTKNYW